MPQTHFKRSVLAGQGGAANVTLAPARYAFAQLDGRLFHFQSGDEARLLAAPRDTFIPEDEFPGVSRAGVLDFIDLQHSDPPGKGEGLSLDGPFPERGPRNEGVRDNDPMNVISAIGEKMTRGDMRAVSQSSGRVHDPLGSGGTL